MFVVLLEEENAKKIAGFLPQRPLSGRWASTTANIKFWKAFGQSTLLSGFEGAFAAHKECKRRKPAKHMTDDNNATEAFGEILGRWEREAIEDLRDLDNWRKMELTYVAQGPAMHLHYWLQKENEVKIVMQKDVRKALDAGYVSPIQSLVYCKAGVFMMEHERLLDEEFYNTLWADLWSSCFSTATLTEHRAEASLYALEAANDFYFRIELNAQSFPWMLSWVVFSKPHYACAKRKWVLTEMLKLLGDSSHASSPSTSAAYKLAALFQHAFGYVVSLGGRFPDTAFFQRFYRMMCQVCMMLPDNTQLVEGENGTVKAIKATAPNISWQLLSSRTVNKLNVNKQFADRKECVQVCSSGNNHEKP